jgi:DNA-binding transcriptional MerR regulator/methylmalonyl-CoA mutase cobalamin-binding subunit
MFDKTWTNAYPVPMNESTPLHPVRVVVQRTGLSPDVLRAWERRYGAVEPVRTAGGQRLYTGADVERLALLHEATRSGRQIGQLVALDDASLRDLIAADRRESVPSAVSPVDAERHIGEAYAAVEAMDPARLELELRQAVLALGAAAALSGVLAPLLERIGLAWQQGRLSVGHEHAASAVVRRFLDWIAAASIPGAAAPAIGLATLEGERHEFGAMLAMAAALANGWSALYFGPEMPVRDLAAAAAARDLTAVGLSVVYVEDPGRVVEAIGALRDALPADVALVVGGSGAARIRGRLADPRVRVVEDLASFVAAIAPLAEGRPR